MVAILRWSPTGLADFTAHRRLLQPARTAVQTEPARCQLTHVRSTAGKKGFRNARRHYLAECGLLPLPCQRDKSVAKRTFTGADVTRRRGSAASWRGRSPAAAAAGARIRGATKAAGARRRRRNSHRSSHLWSRKCSECAARESASLCACECACSDLACYGERKMRETARRGESAGEEGGRRAGRRASPRPSGSRAPPPNVVLLWLLVSRSS